MEVRHCRETEEDATSQGVSPSRPLPKSRREPNPARRRVPDATISNDIRQERDSCLELVTFGILDAGERLRGEYLMGYGLLLRILFPFHIPEIY